MTKLPTLQEYLAESQRAYLPGVTRDDVWKGLDWASAYHDLWPGRSKPKAKDADCRFDSQKDAEEYADSILRLFADMGDPIEVFRAVRSDGPPGLDSPGESWSFRREAALAFGGHNGSNWLMSAKVKRRGVDWRKTVEAYVQFSGNFSEDDECEIVVRDSHELTDMKIVPLKKKGSR